MSGVKIWYILYACQLIVGERKKEGGVFINGELAVNNETRTETVLW